MSTHRIKVAVVNYLNTKPFIHGLLSGHLKDEIQLIECIPAQCAELFHTGAVDLSLIPVGALTPSMVHRVSDYGIASDGPVASVCILSEVPKNQIKALYLDYQSRTSVLLARVLVKNYWDLSPAFIPGAEGYEIQIQGTTAGLVIGDRALALKSKYPYVYDLGEVWKAYTHLPFVYAIWQSTRPLPEDFLVSFNQSLRHGVSQLPALIASMPAKDRAMLTTYFNQHIRYELNATFDLGLKRFMDESSALTMDSVESEKANFIQIAQ